MANDFLTAQAGNIAGVALELLRREIVLPGLVHRAVDTDFIGGRGASVTIPSPMPRAARQFNGIDPIQLDELAETGVPVVLSKHSYNGAPIPDLDAAVNVTDFSRQILVPQVQAVAEAIEDDVAATFAAVPATGDIVVDRAATDPVLSLLTARQRLSEAKVAHSGRRLVVGTEFSTILLGDDRLSRADAGGNATALETGRIGTVFGFEVFESLAIEADAAYAFTREAIAMASVAPPNPRGATASETVNESGLLLRWLSDYDAAFLRDRSIVSVLHGSALLDATRIVRLRLSAAA